MLPFSIILGTACPILYIENADINTTSDFYYGDSINITCHAGYQFEDGSSQQLATCGPDGQFIMNFSVCVRMYFTFYSIIIIIIEHFLVSFFAWCCSYRCQGVFKTMHLMHLYCSKFITT